MGGIERTSPRDARKTTFKVRVQKTSQRADWKEGLTNVSVDTNWGEKSKNKKKKGNNVNKKGEWEVPRKRGGWGEKELVFGN